MSTSKPSAEEKGAQALNIPYLIEQLRDCTETQEDLLAAADALEAAEAEVARLREALEAVVKEIEWGREHFKGAAEKIVRDVLRTARAALEAKP